MTTTDSIIQSDLPGYPGIDQFEAGDISPGAFGHAAHIYVAWSYLRTYSFPEASKRYTDGLKHLVTKFGVAEKYHESITIFLLGYIAEKMALAPQATWSEFRASNDALFERAGKLMDSHYSPERLNSALARKQFLLPDRVPEPA